MKPRTLQILQALISGFIETANPIASNNLLKSYNFTISSSTVRNEFAILEEVGLIKSPHISAGKVPTEKGYRFYVDELLEEEKEEAMVNSLFKKHVQSYRLEKSKETVLDALRIAAHLSGNVAFAMVESDKTFYIGLSHVLRSPEYISDPEKGAQIVEILEGREKFHALLNSLNIPKEEIKIFIGEENILDEISSCAMVVTSFVSKNIQGKLGILGPMRMKYGFNKAMLRNVVEFIC